MDQLILESFYPPGERSLFVDRADVLQQLDRMAEVLTDERRSIHLAFFGLRRLGKTSVLKRFLIDHIDRSRTLPIYINLEPAASTAASLALHILGWCSFWAWAPSDASPDDYLSPADLRRQRLPERARSMVDQMLTVIGDPRTPAAELLRRSFGLPRTIAQLEGLPVVAALDEFQAVRGLERQRDVGSPLALLREELVRSSGSVTFVLAGSSISTIGWILSDARSPLFGHLLTLSLGPLPREDARELVRKLLSQVDLDAQHHVAKLCNDHPYYIRVLCERLRLWGATVTRDLIEAAFYTELASASGALNLHCAYLVDLSLAQARYTAVLRALLEGLAAGGPQTIGQLLRRSSLRGQERGNLRHFLRELERYGLVVGAKEGGKLTYAVADPVVARWILVQHLGLTGEDLTSGPSAGQVQQLRERLARVSRELAEAKEAQVRELLRSLAGSELPGELLGTDGMVKVPPFERVSGYLSSDGRTELDALARGPQTWAVEVRWQVAPADVEDLRRLVEKGSRVGAGRLWFISRAGFRPKAVEFGRRSGMLLSDRASLEWLLATYRD